MKKVILGLALFSLKGFAASCLITMTVKDNVGVLVLPAQQIYAESIEECAEEAQYSYRFFDRFLDDKLKLQSIDISYIEVELDRDGNKTEKRTSQKVKPAYASFEDYLYPLMGGNISGKDASLQNEKKLARIDAQRQRDNLRNN